MDTRGKKYPEENKFECNKTSQIVELKKLR